MFAGPKTHTGRQVVVSFAQKRRIGFKDVYEVDSYS